MEGSNLRSVATIDKGEELVRIGINIVAEVVLPAGKIGEYRLLFHREDQRIPEGEGARRALVSVVIDHLDGCSDGCIHSRRVGHAVEVNQVVDQLLAQGVKVPTAKPSRAVPSAPSTISQGLRSRTVGLDGRAGRPATRLRITISPSVDVDHSSDGRSEPD
jgi:hypothetical protein